MSPILDLELPASLTSDGKTHHHLEDSEQGDLLLIACMSQQWHNGQHLHLESDKDSDEDDAEGSGEAPKVPFEDGLNNNESDVFNWDVLNQEYGTTFCDELGESFESRYFDSSQDIALGLLTDGFAPFNKCKSTACDISAISMVMWMKGHNGASSCHMCKIQELHIPDQPGTTLYVPLDHSSYPDIQTDHSHEHRQKYDPHNLPLCTYDRLLSQAAEVDAANTITAADTLSKEYGIKGTPLLSHAWSLSFPHSFPYNFMHLIWENTIKNLILHWTYDFKGLGQGNEHYELSKVIWEGIGTLTASSGSTTPSAYGC
ncbi:hypothetical protein BJY52DRAFT_1231174 [Lactarius psammicola]|nr:hypothetical protein BJY52DRAFT_1231174 [Lactarius psammicola]